MAIATENIINVQELEPRLRHQTIFNVFNTLREGESLIIHNNHDPMPVNHQLMNLRGNIFSWEYLQKGPEWWDIKVTRQVPVIPGEKDSDLILNIPALEPQQKHALIFHIFDQLEAGETFIIHNDHDPKPVYYQLKGERGDVFTWEYLTEGPEWWDIRVSKKEDEIQETIGQIVAKDISKTTVFKKYGIDFCCNGNRSVREACEAKGIDYRQVEEELKQVTGTVTGNSNLNYDEWDLDFLADYVVNTHHKYVRKYLPEIVQYMKKVAKVHGEHHPELAAIKEQVNKIDTELNAHMVEEETLIFPLVKEIVAATNSGAAYTREPGKTFRELVEETEKEHDSVGRALEEIRKLNNDYAIPEDACTSYKLLYQMLQELESDLFTHIHLENNILFVKARAREHELLSA